MQSQTKHASLVVELAAACTALVIGVPVFVAIAGPLLLFDARWHVAAGAAALVALPLALYIRALSVPVAARHIESRDTRP